MNRCAAELAAAIGTQLPPGTTGLVVALSGGADSACLLAAARICAQGAALGWRAVHVDHGLQAAAADFRRVCEALCARLA
ncbi:MAG: tRNA(Ile)-lysidine synthetase, partial [Gammaproteobacteria bacterium]|nr:tRNA(Ile)-lysidine synthetase [Gammaproteobacteria bacterium]